MTNATFTNTSQVYEGVAMYTCVTGLEESVGVNNWNITCQSNGMWSEGTNCISKDNHQKKLTDKNVIYIISMLQLHT